MKAFCGFVILYQFILQITYTRDIQCLYLGQHAMGTVSKNEQYKNKHTKRFSCKKMLGSCNTFFSRITTVMF